jgi:hypothetical protein
MRLSQLPIILGFFFLLVTIPFAVLLLSKRQQTEVSAGLNKNALVYLWPQEFALPQGTDAAIELMVETKGQPSRRAEATLSFDPTFFRIEEDGVSAPTGVDLNQKVVDNSRGIIELAGVGKFETVKTLAKINVSALQKGASQIKVAEAHVWDPTGTVDMLKDAEGAQITIE